ncbi:hypothetical protein L208DRAFT_1268243, partial [Tricholoma matsutake]
PIVVCIPKALKPMLTRPNEPVVETPQPNEHEPDSDSSDGISSDDDGNAKHKEATKQEFAASQKCFAKSRPSHIPDGLGVVIVNEKHERDNELWMMPSHFIFSSIRSNQVYAGKTAAVASNYKGCMDMSYMTDGNQHLYSYLPQRFPMNPYEVSQGVHFINDTKESSVDRVEAYRLLSEFHCIAGGFVPELRDLAMQEILNNDVYLHKVYKPCPIINSCGKTSPSIGTKTHSWVIDRTRPVVQDYHPYPLSNYWTLTLWPNTQCTTDASVAATLFMALL